MDRSQVLRRLPSVDAVFSREDMQPLVQKYPRAVVLEGIRRALEARRKALLAGGQPGAGSKEGVSGKEVSQAILEWTFPPLQGVINATGVILHTNLARAPLSPEATRHVAEIAAGYSNLEMNLQTGQRGSRMDVVRQILLERTGAEDALVVNNNAAAVYLSLRALAVGKEVVVSRGELVEIGGSFRIPDVMQASGARLVEVGTTNKTRIEDYRRAVGPDTALLLKVHRSNFALVGFTEEASIAELARLAQECSVPFMLDLGSGTLLEHLPPEMGHVPTVAKILGQGVDLVCFSGDKLLGGPQSGILLGKKKWIQLLAQDPMARAVRVCKLTLAALWATLSQYRGGDQGARAVPVVGMLFAEPSDLEQRANQLWDAIKRCGVDLKAEVVPTEGQVGGGTMPLVVLPGFGVALAAPEGNAEVLAGRLRTGTPPVLARLHEDRVVLDVRTVIDSDQLMVLADAVRVAAGGCGG